MKYFYTDVRRYGQSILYRGYTEDGQPIQKRIKFKPHVFAPVNERWGTKDSVHLSGWKTLHGDAVEPIEMESMRDAKEFFEKYDGVDNFKVHGNTNYVSQWMQRTWPEDIEYNSRFIRVANIDIEVATVDANGENQGFPVPEEANYPIISIALKCSSENVYYVWGLDDYDISKTELNLDGALIQYFKCESESDLLRKFIARWQRLNPDVITGWNVRLFDVPYLINRIRRLMGDDAAKELSPWKHINYREVNLKGKTLDTYDVYGIQQMDYYDLFQKFGYSYGTQESYALDHIAHTVLGERKLSYEEHGSLHTLYRNDHQKFIDYNIKDVQLVDKIDKETGLMELAILLAYKGGVNYADTFGTTAIWDSFIYRYLCQHKIVLPPSKKEPKTSYPGGYVKDPKIGMSEWVVSFDLASLYPNLIIQYNMSPETIVDGEVDYPNGVDHYLVNSSRDDEYSTTANGVKFRKDVRGMLPEIIVKLYDERRITKNKMLELQKENNKKNQTKILQLNNNQMAIKILMNSLYGAIGNNYFRYYDLRVAEGITLSGQLSIRWAERAVNDYMNKLLGTNDDYVIAIDTDSVYVNMEPLVNMVNPDDPVKFLDQVCKLKFEPMIAKSYDELFRHMNAYENRMEMEREVIADRGIWTAKKRYILNVHNSEGVQYNEPKIKMMGLEAVKSSTPQVVRDKFKEAFKILLTGEEKNVQKFVADFEKEFKSLSPEDVSFPRGVTAIEKWKDRTMLYKKGTPIHVRGAILYNQMLKEKGMDKVEESIKNGTKVKFTYLKMPNPLRENVISYPQFLPREFELHKYVDYDTQFEKTFKEPLKVLTDAIEWELEQVNTLEDFF